MRDGSLTKCIALQLYHESLGGAGAGGIAGPWMQANNGITGTIAAAAVSVAVVSIIRYENIVVAGVVILIVLVSV